MPGPTKQQFMECIVPVAQSLEDKVPDGTRREAVLALGITWGTLLGIRLADLDFHRSKALAYEIESLPEQKGTGELMERIVRAVAEVIFEERD